jgi:NADPH-dependent ferric siderophore reductase
MTKLVAHAHIALADPESVVGQLCEHLSEHGAVVTWAGGGVGVAFGDSHGHLSIKNGCLIVEAEARDIAGLQEIKQAIASHVIEFSPPDRSPQIVWKGDGIGISAPPDFRVLTVLDVQDVTPHMRRITFRGEDLSRFDRLDALHVRLFIPPAGLANPAWPTVGPDGLLRLPPERERPAVRKYTIRTIDVAAGTLDIDFVLHDDAGPGSTFAAGARTGNCIGMAGPGGRGLQKAGWYAFLADQTALPALSRMLENLPPTAIGVAVVEVASTEEEQNLLKPEGIEIRWLHRHGAAPGTTTLLPNAFEAIEWPRDDVDIYLWAAMEYSAFKTIRAAARKRLRPDRDSHLIVSYWRRGSSEEQHSREKSSK